jgi:hypothetical protein
MAQVFTISLLDMHLAICRLEPGDVLAATWLTQGPFTAIIRTLDETSIVCEMHNTPPGSKVNAGWRAFKIHGPLPFELLGVIATLSQILAQAGISIFAISTYDTDYLLVKESNVKSAINALSAAGHTVFGE